MTQQATAGTTAASRFKAIYEQQGWCRLSHRLTNDEIEKLRASVERHISERPPGVTYEEGSGAVRGIHGCHRFDQVCSDLTRLPQLVDVAEEVLGSRAYVYQFKVNLKQAKQGAEWPWHQDFPFWQVEDGMPAPISTRLSPSAAVLNCQPRRNIAATRANGTPPRRNVDSGLRLTPSMATSVAAHPRAHPTVPPPMTSSAQSTRRPPVAPRTDTLRVTAITTIR
ncbi:phytanoyl-CoA dioxygenase family protein [Microtetraspora niveoalba]|uniref:phytanoyl-CoA dioxygenase family protein n=1 Tax=Microtetraspora niveoalba TaxID=46175 RepID=UPI000A06CA19